MKIVYNIYVAVRKLWNAIFGKNGDGSQLVIPGRISGASGDVTVGDGLNLTNNVMKSTVPVVSANPETGESDPELTGLMIGSNKYKIPSSGKQLYTHHLTMSVTGFNSTLKACVITDNNTPFTKESFIQYLTSVGATTVANGLGVSGKMYTDGNNNIRVPLIVHAQGAYLIALAYGVNVSIVDNAISISPVSQGQDTVSTLNDFVVEI